jgi:hypothetical protein
VKIAEIHSDGGEPRSFGRDVSRYVLSGERVPSVTEVIELAGLSDIQKIIAVAGEEVVANAARRGSLVHGYCELLDHDPYMDLGSVPEWIRGYVAGYARFVRETGFRPDLIEEPVVSSAYRFAGTVDRVGNLGTKPYVIDLKTPAAASPSWAVQTAGYAIGVEEQYGVRAGRACLQLKSNGTYKLHNHADPSDVATFIAAVHVAHYRLAHGLAHLEA